MSAPAPLVLQRTLFHLQKTTAGVPRSVRVKAWGSPLETAEHTLFYFGGMPASVEEPALHSLAAATPPTATESSASAAAPTTASTTTTESVATPPPCPDVYATRKICCICIDKPGMGESSFSYWFQLNRDWPHVVHQVAEQLGVERYSVMGMSNGGPYVMACLTHPLTQPHVTAGVMVVGVSNVWASGYFSWRHASGVGEGLFNSLPIVLTGPLNWCMFSLGGWYLSQWGGYRQLFSDLPSLRDNPGDQVPTLLRKVVADGVKTGGLGSAVDCQQGLSPLFAKNKAKTIEEYKTVSCPVRLWYGTKDSSVPMASAEWLEQILPNAKLFRRDTGHGLYFYHVEEVLDDLLNSLQNNSGGVGNSNSDNNKEY